MSVTSTLNVGILFALFFKRALKINAHKIIRRLSFMNLIIALVIPWLYFLKIGRPSIAVFCAFLQLILFGGVSVETLSVNTLVQAKTDQTIQQALHSRSSTSLDE